MAINRITQTGYDDPLLRDSANEVMFGAQEDGRWMRDLAVRASTELAWLQYKLEHLPQHLEALRRELQQVREEIRSVVALGVRPVEGSRRRSAPHTELLSALQARETELQEDVDYASDMLGSRLQSTPFRYYEQLLDECQSDDGRIYS